MSQYPTPSPTTWEFLSEDHLVSATRDNDPDSRSSDHGLPSRNVVIDGKRTSVRLDSHARDSLSEIAAREKLTINELCTLIHESNKITNYSFSTALRIFMLAYFRLAATEEGHHLAGHAAGHPLYKTPFDQTPAQVDQTESPGTPPTKRRRPPQTMAETHKSG